ncbi:MAG: hypothetical protein ACYCX2_11135 [Christensenellales bacterium]
MVSKYIVLSGKEKYILRVTNHQDITDVEISPRISQMELILLDGSGNIRTMPLQDGKCKTPNFPLEKLSAAAVIDGRQIVAKGALNKTDWNRVAIMLLGKSESEVRGKNKIMAYPADDMKADSGHGEIEIEPALAEELPKVEKNTFHNNLFDALTDKWPNSKWEKIDYPGCPSRYYLTGEIYGADGLLAVCYAVPGSAYMPYLGSSYYVEEDGAGYWLFFQYTDGSLYDDLIEG